MPRELKDALARKGGLTLSQLANYDDMLTDALVDKVHFWSSIRKLKASYHQSRGVRDADVCEILQQDVVIRKDAPAAHKKILALPGIKRFYNGLGDDEAGDDQKEHFERHLRKYVNIWLPDCPFEVDTTNRYNIATQEAKIVARKPIRRGEPIKYLTGIQVEMTEKEERELNGRTDFSIVLSSRRKRPSLFLGPARFANHDCDSNGRLNTTGPHGIHIMARKDIAAGEEITVTYGEDYFGVDNCECLCGTCESLLRNGWDPRGPLLHEESSDEESESEHEGSSGAMKVPRRPPPPRKRKHGGEASESESDFEATPRKKRGRPRKYANDDLRSLQKPARIDQYLKHRKRGGRSRFLSGKGKKGERRDGLLDNILQMLWDVGGREPPRGYEDPVLTEILQSFAALDDASGQQGGFDPGLLINGATAAGSRKGSRERSAPIDITGSDAENDLQARWHVPGTSVSRLRSTSDLVQIKNETAETSRNEVNLWGVPDSKSPASEQQIPTPPKPSSSRGNAALIPRIVELADSSVASSSSSNTFDEPAQSPPSSSTSVDGEAAKDGGQRAGDFSRSNLDYYVDDDSEPVPNDWAVRDSATQLKHMNGENANQEPIDMSESEATPKRPTTCRSPNRGPPSTSGEITSQPAPDPVHSIEQQEEEDEADGEEEEELRGPVRTPGDYCSCKSLLATPYHRWVECRNCDENFLQSEAYLTRIACPRCERHSKLYGYYWPKTDREGKHDREARVLDHRTIHRFIEPEEERMEKKGRKTLADMMKERDLSSMQESEEEQSGGLLRPAAAVIGRRSQSRRMLRMTM